MKRKQKIERRICPICKREFDALISPSRVGRGIYCSRSCRARYDHKSHGHTSNNQYSSTYSAWIAMRSRCNYESHSSFPNYGKRGITVCERWNKFANFLADMGERPNGYTLDRINNDGNYEPSNCKWSSKKEQGMNKRTNRMVSWNGKTQCVAAWAEELGIAYETLSYRVRHWPIEKAFTERIIFKKPNCSQPLSLQLNPAS